jgi:hypothetical protein
MLAFYRTSPLQNGFFWTTTRVSLTSNRLEMTTCNTRIHQTDVYRIPYRHFSQLSCQIGKNSVLQSGVVFLGRCLAQAINHQQAKKSESTRYMEAAALRFFAVANSVSCAERNTRLVLKVRCKSWLPIQHN